MRRDEDGYLPEVGPWAEVKYEHVRSYATMFSTGMRKQWRTRVYVDLFTGAGQALIEGTSHVVQTSALIALGVRHRFDRYVLCEKSPRSLRALRARVSREAPGVDVRFVPSDCNAQVAQVLAALPPSSARDAIACCFVDPYGLSDLKFETLRRLAAGRRIDFLVLVPSHMDANRNERLLTRPSDPTLDEFLGSSDWRERWARASKRPAAPSFGTFVVEELGRSMQSLRYLKSEPKDAVLVDDRNRCLYHLALFSRNPRGSDFWAKTKRSASKQRGLFEN